MSKVNETIVDQEESISRVYEMSYILVPTMSEEAANLKADSFEKSIADLGASFISKESPYMRELAYEMVRVIKNANNRFDMGYFGWVKFEMSPSLVAKFEKAIALDEDVIRYLVVKADRDVNIFTKRAMQVKTRENDEANIDTANQDQVVSAEVEAPSEEVVAEPVKE